MTDKQPINEEEAYRITPAGALYMLLKRRGIEMPIFPLVNALINEALRARDLLKVHDDGGIEPVGTPQQLGSYLSCRERSEERLKDLGVSIESIRWRDEA